jgi:3-methyladenine DNA glycosylase Mpg
MANLVGGVIVGAGAYITGSSPEAAVAQVGSGKRKALMTVAGGFTGVLAYGFLEKYLRDSFLGAPGKL